MVVTPVSYLGGFLTQRLCSQIVFVPFFVAFRQLLSGGFEKATIAYLHTLPTTLFSAIIQLEATSDIPLRKLLIKLTKYKVRYFYRTRMFTSWTKGCFVYYRL